MFEKMDIFRQSSGLARHAGERQSLIAENIANADTPGYRARDLGDFAKTVDSLAAPALRQTRPGHLASHARQTSLRPSDMPDETSPNGNTVTLEDQIVKSASAQHEHETALAVYHSALKFMRSAIGRGR